MAKLLRVNMTEGRVTYEEVPERYRMLSARGLTSQIVYDEVKPTCNPLGPYNKLVIAPGLFAGTRVPCSARISVGAKSPLTGTIKESNAGGTVARRLAKLGIKAVIIEGKPLEKTLYVLKITKDNAFLIPAQDLSGKGNYDTMRILQETHGSRMGIMSIGQSGEMLLNAASIAISDPDGLPNRHCGRGGMGAVMGSKGIKAIVIDDTGADERLVEVADEGGFNAVAKEWAEKLTESGKTLRAFGTAFLVDPITAVGGFPTRNFSEGNFEGYEKINGASLVEKINERGGKAGHPCSPGCVIRCSNVYNDANGNYLVSGIEYETIGLMGSNLGIDCLDTIARLNRKCNDYGLDTIEVGGALGVAMEAGIANFGDTEAALKLVDEIGSGTILGRLLGSGSTITGKVLGVYRVPAVKGQNMPAYDPRALKGTGTTYATSTQGADHTMGNALPGRYGVDPNKKDQQVEVSRNLQINTAVVDGLGLCLFVGPMPPTMEIITRLMSTVVGRQLSVDDILEMGKNILRVERDFNRAAGFTNVHDRLPEFFTTEVLGPKGVVFDITDEELDEVFNF
jgi:aldehyde:ferredoxin oxidoreductase